MKCPNCNATDHQPEAKFCLHCGASLLAIQCPKCKATNHNPNARFCFHCGAPLALMVCPQCNTIDHQLGSRFCLRCGTQLVHTINTCVELFEEDTPISTPDGVEAIDLGLPSRSIWASCNVGATKPESIGDYYAWGMTEEDEQYDWSTYIHCNGSAASCHYLGQSISGTEYDVANTTWGKDWQIPTLVQLYELHHVCSYEWTTLNGVKGGKFTGPNGNSIFLPAAGYYDGNDLINYGSHGYYIAGTQGSRYNGMCFVLSFYDGYAHWSNNNSRCNGFSVRPVTKSTKVWIRGDE